MSVIRIPGDQALPGAELIVDTDLHPEWVAPEDALGDYDTVIQPMISLKTESPYNWTWFEEAADTGQHLAGAHRFRADDDLRRVADVLRPGERPVW